MNSLLQYAILLLLTLGTAGLIGIIYLIKQGITGKPVEEPGKNEPFESGFIPEEPAWKRYHIHYYGFALLFLAFDMEMAFMYPWAVVYKELGITALIDMGVFLVILFLGLLYAWSQGGLKRQ